MKHPLDNQTVDWVEEKPKLSHQYRKGAYVVYRDACLDSLFEVKKVIRWADYLEIRETKCRHSNRKAYGSNGSDIRHATPEEIKAGRRMEVNP